MWLILRLKMSWFSHQGFLGGGGGGGGGGHGILLTVVGYAVRGGRENTHQIIGGKGASKKCKGKNHHHSHHSPNST